MKNKYELNLYKKLCNKEGCQEEDSIKHIILKATNTSDLHLCGRTLSTKACKVIAEILKKSKTIRSLDFSDCLLNPDGLRYIIQSIIISKYIKVLNLYGNNIRGDTVLELGILLANNGTLKHLILKWNNLGLSEQSFAAFCLGLAQNESLETLDLRNNRIGPDCASNLACALRYNKVLKNLDLRWNRICNKGAENFLEILNDNKSLKNLQLQGNCIDKNIITSIENSLKKPAETQILIVKQPEEKLDVLNDKINALVQTEKRLQEAYEKVNELYTKLELSEKVIQQHEEQIKKLNSNLIDEKMKGLNYENHLEEIEKLYNNALESINQGKKILNEKEIEILKIKTDADEQYKKEKEKLENVQLELSTEKKKNLCLMDEIALLKSQILNLNQLQTETLENERNMWQKRYNELESSKAQQLEKLKVVSLDKQKSLENKIVELNNKQVSEIITQTKRCEKLIEEKSRLKERLADLQNTVSSLKRENLSLIAQLDESKKNITSLENDLSKEKLTSDKFKQQNLTDKRIINELKNDIEKLNLNNVNLEKEKSDLNVKFNEEILKLNKKIKVLENDLSNKQKKILEMRKSEKERINSLHNELKKYLERLNSSFTLSQDS